MPHIAVPGAGMRIEPERKTNGQRNNWLVFDSDHPYYAGIESYIEFERFP
jgi:hypothetical protein